MASKVDLSRSQMIGATAIACLLIFILALPNILPAHPSLIVSDLDSSQLEYVSLEDEMDSTESEERRDEINHYSSEKKLFNFDPNTLDQNGFEDLGFSSKQTKSILKYRKSYGPFKSAEDFGKIYVVSEDKYRELKPYIQIAEEEVVLIELNSASENEFIKISGIGEKRAKTIVKYRNKLGGFYSNHQLEELYGFPPEVVSNLQDATTIDLNKIEKLSINEASKKELENHPYFDFETVALILRQRDRAPIKSLDFLAESVDAVRLEKIKHYISFE